MTPVLEVRGLCKSFDGIVVADDITMRLDAGCVVALVGPNGAGKTSLLNLITGIIPADRGTIMLHGKPIVALPAHTRARRGVTRTWQHLRLFPSLSIIDNLLIAPREYVSEQPWFAFRRRTALREQTFDRALRALQRVGLADMAEVLPTELSYGRQKLVALARALVNDGECLLLDEPMAGVEEGVYEIVRRIVRDEAESGRAICIIEHNTSFVRDLCDLAVFMFNGRIIATGSIGRMMEDPALIDLYFGL